MCGASARLQLKSARRSSGDTNLKFSSKIRASLPAALITAPRRTARRKGRADRWVAERPPSRIVRPRQPLGFGLFGDGAHHAFVEIDILDLNVCDLDAPSIGLLIEDLLDIRI